MSDERRRVRRSHPILRLEVLGPNGERRSAHRVFCRHQKKSVPVGVCCSCVHCDGIVTDPVPAVACTVPVDASAAVRDSLGLRTPVGEVLTEGVFAVVSDTTIGDALALLRSEDRRSLAVVDDRSIVVGVVHEGTFAGLPSGRASSEDAGAECGHFMSTALALPESTSVRRALEVLAAAHLREATVVDASGVPLGRFLDIDGLHWIFSARDR